jgi:DNA-binding response OmpR family regulator
VDDVMVRPFDPRELDARVEASSCYQRSGDGRPARAAR